MKASSTEEVFSEDGFESLCIAGYELLLICTVDDSTSLHIVYEKGTDLFTTPAARKHLLFFTPMPSFCSVPTHSGRIVDVDQGSGEY